MNLNYIPCCLRTKDQSHNIPPALTTLISLRPSKDFVTQVALFRSTETAKSLSFYSPPDFGSVLIILFLFSIFRKPQSMRVVLHGSTVDDSGQMRKTGTLNWQIPVQRSQMVVSSSDINRALANLFGGHITCTEVVLSQAIFTVNMNFSYRLYNSWGRFCWITV